MFLAARTSPSLTTLILLSALSVLSLNMFLPSLGQIATELRVDYGVANLSVAGYLAITAFLQLVMGPLSDRYGRRPVLLIGMGLFAVASVGCFLAQDIWVFLAFRMLQGGVIGAVALSRAAVRDMYDERTAASLLGYISMVMALAPMIGPVVGGFLDQLFGWRANFAFFAVSGMGLLALCWFDFGETNTARSATIGEQLRTYPELLKSRRFWGYAICMTFAIGSFYVYITGAALVGGKVFGFSPAAIGATVGGITAGFVFGSFLSGRLSRRYPLIAMTLAGRIVASFGLCAGLAFVLSGVVHPLSYVGCVMFVGMGNGLTLPAAGSGVMSVRPRLAGSAAGLSGAMSVAGGAVLTSLTGALLNTEDSALVLLLIMTVSVGISLLAALYVHWVDRKDPLPLDGKV